MTCGWRCSIGDQPNLTNTCRTLHHFVNKLQTSFSFSIVSATDKGLTFSTEVFFLSKFHAEYYNFCSTLFSVQNEPDVIFWSRTSPGYSKTFQSMKSCNHPLFSKSYVDGELGNIKQYDTVTSLNMSVIAYFLTLYLHFTIQSHPKMEKAAQKVLGPTKAPIAADARGTAV